MSLSSLVRLRLMTSRIGRELVTVPKVFWLLWDLSSLWKAWAFLCSWSCRCCTRVLFVNFPGYLCFDESCTASQSVRDSLTVYTSGMDCYQHPLVERRRRRQTHTTGEHIRLLQTNRREDCPWKMEVEGRYHAWAGLPWLVHMRCRGVQQVIIVCMIHRWCMRRRSTVCSVRMFACTFESLGSFVQKRPMGSTYCKQKIQYYTPKRCGENSSSPCSHHFAVFSIQWTDRCMCVWNTILIVRHSSCVGDHRCWCQSQKAPSCYFTL